MLDVTGEMEGGWNGGGVLGFSLRFDPMRTGFDRALVSLPASVLISHLLGWTENISQGRSLGSAVVAAIVAVYLAARFVSDQQPRLRCLAASVVHKPNSGMQPVFSGFSC